MIFKNRQKKFTRTPLHAMRQRTRTYGDDRWKAFAKDKVLYIARCTNKLSTPLYFYHLASSWLLPLFNEGSKCIWLGLWVGFSSIYRLSFMHGPRTSRYQARNARPHITYTRTPPFLLFPRDFSFSSFPCWIIGVLFVHASRILPLYSSALVTNKS